jgi:hypothetical protein
MTHLLQKPIDRYMNLFIIVGSSNIIICKSVFWTSSMVYISIKITTFRKLHLLPSSGKKGRTEILAVGSPGFSSLRTQSRSEASSTRGPNS